MDLKKNSLIDKKILSVLFIWLIVIFYYYSHTVIDHCGNDPWQQYEYTEIIVKEHRMPKPYEKFSTFHPPLYYIVASFISPESILSDEKESHFKEIKNLSVICGIIFLLITNWFLFQVKKESLERALVLLFIATTPKFTFMFTAYNNDTFVLLFAALVFYFAYRLYLKWSNNDAIFLLLSSTAGLYTKYNFVVPIGTLFVICIIGFIFKSIKKKETLFEKKVFLILILSIALFFPWLYFHNLKYSGEFLPANHNTHAKIHSPSLFKYIGVVLPTAIPQNFLNKWKDPFGHTYDHPQTKKYDYWSSGFLCSVYQGGDFKINDNLQWALLITHLMAYLIGFTTIFKSNITRLCGLAFLINHTYMAFRFVTSMGIKPFDTYGGENPSVFDYRYIGWEYMFWAIFYLSSLDKKILGKIMKVILVLAIAFQIYFLLNIKGALC